MPKNERYFASSAVPSSGKYCVVVFVWLFCCPLVFPGIWKHAGKNRCQKLGEKRTDRVWLVRHGRRLVINGRTNCVSRIYCGLFALMHTAYAVLPSSYDPHAQDGKKTPLLVMA